MSRYTRVTYPIGWAVDANGRELTREERLAYEKRMGFNRLLDEVFERPERLTPENK